MTEARLKRRTCSDKFPLTLHPTGQYCKKIRGKLYYFGSDKQQALEQYLDVASCLHAGRSPRMNGPADSVPLKVLCNLYLDHQESRVVACDIGPRQLHDQTRLLRRFARYIGPSRAVSDIATIDLQNYRRKLIRDGKAPTTVNNHINAFKAMFHWALENEVIQTAPNLKAIKKISRTKEIKTIFTSEQIQRLLQQANRQMKAMIWLGLNCGFGCTDCAELLWEHVDLETGRVNFPRPKTNVNRDLPLWRQTINALKALPRSNERVFNTAHGNKYVRIDRKERPDGTIISICYDAIGKEFTKVLKKAGIKGEKGMGFYTLRRTAATIAARSGDPFAVQKLLGHADLKMASTYVQDVSEQTDRVIHNSEKLIVRDDF